MRLTVRDVPPRTAWSLEQAGVHPLLARLYAARGITSSEQLDDSLARLLPPQALHGADRAAALLADAIARRPGRRRAAPAAAAAARASRRAARTR